MYKQEDTTYEHTQQARRQEQEASPEGKVVVAHKIQ